MTDLVRVRLENGAEKNVGRGFAKAKGLEILDDSTHSADGAVRATTRNGGRRKKPKTSVAKKAAAKQAAVTESAPSNEE